MASLTRAFNLLRRSNPKLTPFTTRCMTISPATDSNDNFSASLPFTVGNETLKHGYYVEGPKYPMSVKCEEGAAYARVDLPGVTKEGVKVWLQGDCLVVKAVEEKKKKKESEGLGFSKDEKARSYGVAINLSDKSYEKEKIRAVMENGVLKVVIPLVKPEDEEGAFKIKVE